MPRLEIENNPESRRRYEFLAGRVNLDTVDYYVPAALRRNFGFPIDFNASALDKEGAEAQLSRTRFDVMTDGESTARKIAEITELVRFNSGVSMAEDALDGRVEKIYPITRTLFREQYMKVPRIEPNPSLAAEDIYRLFVLAFAKKYLDSSGKPRLAMSVIDNDEMRHFYNGLVNEYKIKPMDGDRILIIVTAMIKNILDIDATLNVTAQRPQG